MINLPNPPVLSSDPSSQVVQLRTYLIQMSEQLNVALNTLDSAVKINQTVSQNDGGSAVTKDEAASQFVTLRSLIIKTADVISSEMESFKLEMDGKYVAISDFGEYQKDTKSAIEGNSEGITQNYSEIQSITNNLNDSNSTFSKYIMDTKAFIRTGSLYEDSDGRNVYGVAVGQWNEDTADGTPEGDTSHYLATFTSKKLSFWKDGSELAYLSNDKLYIQNAEILNSLTIDGKWEVTANGGFTVKWIGG